MMTSRDPRPGAALRVTLHGDLDLGGAAEVRRRLPVLLATPRPIHVKLDLAGVTFLDCSGARTLRWLDGRVSGRGGTLTLVRPSERVVRLLRLLDLDRELRISHEEGDGVPPQDWRLVRLGPPRPDPETNPGRRGLL
ncbi:STAS domain-containing protein [Sphaerisporangium corydalis]|uniref:STAS domain-containing protein n=1 Tax=Sphaerisporangium corydalis TaxID=1441875 RepID=A0ABV9EPV1_9ACTN|nr:STAS domain-containing protein [Sphaerisporangium corydalis]